MTRTLSRPAAGLILALLATAAANAQTPPQPPQDQVDALASLSRWVGEWEGDGRTGAGEGSRPFHVRQSVGSRLGGTLFVLEAHGTTVLAEGEDPVPIYDALSLLYWDSGAGGYRLATHTAAGRHGVVDLTVLEDGRLQWGFDTADGEVRFLDTIDGDRWTETGEVSTDGTTWTRFHSMELTRLGDD
ncbi:MAG: hypothetical protein R2991_10970 [Thermoanaerobaculia bacterium]